MPRHAGDRPESDSRRFSTALWIVLVCAAAVVPYLPSLTGGFCLDDWHLIVKSPLAHSLEHAPRAFLQGFLPEAFGTDLVYYRPLVTISYQVNYALSGPDPLAFRLTNILLNLVAALLVFAAARKLTGSDFAAGIAGLVFAVLPSHAQSVAWISGRTDIMSAVFMLAAFIVFSRSCGQGANLRLRPLAACSLLFLCALLSKESALVLPVVLAGYAWIFGRRVTCGEALKWAAVVLLPLAVYLPLRRHAVGAALDTHMGLLLKERLTGVGIAYAAYLRMMFVPGEMQVVYDVFPIGMRYPALAYAAWLIPLGLAALAVRLRKRQPVLSFASFWVLVTLLPVSNILPTVGPLPAERFVYLASVGSSVVWGLAVRWVYSNGPRSVRVWPAAVAAVICALILNAAALTIQGSTYYISDVAWARAVARSRTRFPIFRCLAGEALAKAGEFEQAEAEYQAALRIDPGMAEAYVGLARIRRWTGRPGDAVELLETALSRVSEDDRLKYRLDYELGLAYAEAHNMEMAVESFERAAAANPEHALAWRNLGKARLKTGDYVGAADAYERAFELMEPRPADRYELGTAYRKSGQLLKAREQFELIIQEDPESEAARSARAQLESEPD